MFKELNDYLTGRRTYLAIIGLVATELLALYGDKIVVLSPGVTTAIVALFGALALYFRGQANVKKG